MTQNKLPEKAEITINLNDFINDPSNLHINVVGFEDCNNIVLDNVSYINGVIEGTYNKPCELMYYDEYVDKSKYPTYVSWFINSGEVERIRADNVNVDLDCDKAMTEHAFLADGGELTPSDEIITKRAFISSRVGFGDSHGTVYMGYVK